MPQHLARECKPEAGSQTPGKEAARLHESCTWAHWDWRRSPCTGGLSHKPLHQWLAEPRPEPVHPHPTSLSAPCRGLESQTHITCSHPLTRESPEPECHEARSLFPAQLFTCSDGSSGNSRRPRRPPRGKLLLLSPDLTRLSGSCRVKHFHNHFRRNHLNVQPKTPLRTCPPRP